MKIYVNNIFKRKKDKVANEEEKNDVKKYELNNNILKFNNEKNNNNKELEYKIENKTESKIKNEDKIIPITYIRSGAKNNIKNRNNMREKNSIKLSEKSNEKKDKKIVTNLLFNHYKLPKSYYFLLFFMIGLAGLSLKIVVDEDKVQMQEDYAVFNNNDNNVENNIEEKNISNQDQSSTNVDTRTEYENIINNIEKKVEETIKVKEVEELKFTKPLDGEISKIYSSDKLIYSKTLEMWKTHDGIDIKGDVGTPVFSIEKGYVEKIYDDAFYGITVVINHGQGYKSSYSNLDEGTEIQEGENIKKGEKIGTIGTTSIGEIKDNPHLHFMLYKNDEIIDPSSIFN